MPHDVVPVLVGLSIYVVFVNAVMTYRQLSLYLPE
jgi:hypothetical protein